jgi:cysteine desulfurase/selenocysteine lyase
MELEEILSDEARRQREFPVTAHRVYMAHAGVSPLPRAAIDAIGAYLDQSARDHQESGGIRERMEEARGAAARLLGCTSREVALLGPTSLGLNLVANGLTWRPGDEVLYYSEDYPANVYPWTKLRSRGVRACSLRPRRRGRITWETVERSLSKNTRLVTLASCHYLSGWRPDLETIGKNLRERGVLFCVDGIQSLGAFPLDLEGVDFLSADSHKWLLGPLGAGIFYVREEAQKKLAPTLLGCWNVRSPDFVAQEEISFYGGARRYEPGSFNVPGILGMLGSLELILRVGVGKIARRIRGLRGEILAGMKDLGFENYGDDDGEGAGASGILSFSHSRRDLEADQGRLERSGISVSLRKDREGTRLLRISPHFYNTGEEVHRLLGSLAEGDRKAPWR